MALKTNELFSSSAGLDETRTVVRESAPKVFALGTGTILRNAPVAFNTSLLQWVPWVDGGANGAGVLKGILFPDPVELHAADESIGHVMLRGTVHAEDVRDASSEADADVNEILRTEARLLGIEVQGLTEVR